MSNSEFENYLALIGKLLQLTRQQQDSIGTELRDHLESRVADLMDVGLNHSQAVKQALEEFGDAALMANNLQFVSQLNRRRWIMRFATFSVVGCFLAAVLTMALWPDNARFGAPDRSVAHVQDLEKDDSAAVAANGKNDNRTNSTVQPRADQVLSASTKRWTSVFQINQQIEKALQEVVNLNYEDVEWGEVRRDLFDKFQFNIITDPLALDAGLADEETISVQLSGIQLETFLKHLLKSKECTFIVKDGALVAIPIENAEDPQFLSIRTFDCRRLISRLDLNRSSKWFKTQPESAMPASEGGMGGGGIGGGTSGGMFCIPESNAKSLQPMTADQAGEIANPSQYVSTREELLTHLVTSMVGDPTKWSQVSSDDGIGNLKVVNGYLVARHTRDVLKDVEVFLNMLEKSLQEDAASPVK